MANIIWSPSALNDLDLIAEYISRDSKDRASLFIDRIIEQIQTLETNPNIGRIIPEIKRPECRELLYGSYRLMYKIENNEIWITGVIHGALNWNSE